MLTLRELQTTCYRAFTEGRSEALLELLAGTDPAAGVAIYRNNLLETCRKTLAMSYPVILQLVGDACFRTLARDYAHRYPSISGNLAGFGECFPALLDGLYDGGPFAYLGDVARLEWACEEAIIAADASPLDLASLARVPETALGGLHLHLHPSCRLVVSRYPVLSIFLANTEGRDGAIELDAAERVLVARTGARVELHPISEADAGFVAALLDRQDLGSACDRAESTKPGFDPTRILEWLARLRLLVEPPPDLSNC